MRTEGKRIFVLTGAGISAESGIPVFQGTNWNGRSHYELANIEMWERDPGLVWQYYSDRRQRAQNTKPNAAHLALAEMEKSGSCERFFLCTQNVDGLHEAAGSEAITHIHGKLFESRCAAGCGRIAFADFSLHQADLPRCACGALLRPNVCWFGEQPFELDCIFRELETCNLFLAVGTSGSVQPVASFVELLRRKEHPAMAIYVGLDEPANSRYFEQVHLGPASVLLPRLLHDLARLEGSASRENER
jgi:NAD-dependent deacetylase